MVGGTTNTEKLRGSHLGTVLARDSGGNRIHHPAQCVWVIILAPPHGFPQNNARQSPDIIRFDYMHIDRRRGPSATARARGGGLPERVSLEYAFPDLIVACINDLPF